MWAIEIWPSEPFWPNSWLKKISRLMPMMISGVTIGSRQQRLGRAGAAEPQPGQAEAEQRAQDGRHDDRDERDLER